MTEPVVTICVPHHEGWNHLRLLLGSMRTLEPSTPRFRILVVDNASADGSREMITDRFPEVDVLALNRNCGFAGALNRAAKESSTSWLAFLNNDMRVHPRWLLEALRAANKHRVACIGCRILTWDGSRTQFAGGEINLLGKGFEWGDEECDVEEERELLFACGGAMLIERELFLRSGGFDEDYEMIYEDVDLGWRLNLFGQKIWYAPCSCVYHRGHASLASLPYSQKAVFYERNSLATMYKNLERETFAAVFPVLMRLGVHRTQAMLPLAADAYDHLRGVQAFFDNLPCWRAKRQWVQEHRKISDEEVFSLFFPHPTRLWACNESHKQVISRSSYISVRRSALEEALRKIGTWQAKEGWGPVPGSR